MYKPRLAVVVVQMRISTRIFGQGPQGYQNPPPGTVLDHTITRKGWYNVFLVSQHVCQGNEKSQFVSILTWSRNTNRSRPIVIQVS